MNTTILKKSGGNIFFWEILLGFIWLAIVLLVNPAGEFPLNDDWAYTKSVLHLVNTGEFIMIDWPAMSLFSHIYWGGLFCYIFGFSFTVLRISTLLLGFVGALIVFKMISKTTSSYLLGFAGALLLMINPLYVSLSFSFMTDVPFISYCLLSIYSFNHYFKNENIIALLLAILFSVIATLTRQMAVLVPFSFALVYVFTKKLSVRSALTALLPFGISIGSLTYYNYWLTSTDRMTPAYATHGSIKAILVQFTQPIGDTLNFIFTRVGAAFFYSAIFLIPLLIFIIPVVLKNQKSLLRSIPVWITTIFTAVYFFYFKNDMSAPFPGNVLYNLGMGPKLLKDSYILNLNVSPVLDVSFWFAVSIIGLIAMFFLILALSDILVNLIRKTAGRELDLKWKTILFFYVISFIYLGFLVFSYFFDRYFVFLVPAIIFILLSNYGNALQLKSKLLLPLSFVFFGLISFFSVSATHDYLSWNRARWKALDYLTKDKEISPTRIDGGFEFNCWHMTGPWRPVDDSISWWCVNDDEYIVSFGRIAKYETLKKFEYSAMFPGSDNAIYVLKRNVPRPEIIQCNMEQFTDDKSNYVTSGKDLLIPVNNSLSSEKSLSGDYSVKLTADDRYGLQFVLKHPVPGELFEILIWKLSQENDVSIVASTRGENKFTFTSNKVNDKNTDGWERVSLRFYAPMDVKDGISLFVMYTKENSVYLDDLTVKIYHMD